MMRANMGNAVMAMAAPMNSAASCNRTFSPNRPGTFRSHGASTAPSTKGTSIPASETAAALFARLWNSSILNSTPTRNM